MIVDFMKESVPRWKGFAGSFQNTPGNHKEHCPPIFLLFVHVVYLYLYKYMSLYLYMYVYLHL